MLSLTVLFPLLVTASAAEGDAPFVPPDAAHLANLPALEREASLSEALSEVTDSETAQRLMTALAVSQWFGEATASDTPSLVPALTDALSTDAEARHTALDRSTLAGKSWTLPNTTAVAAPELALTASLAGSVRPAYRHLTLQDGTNRRGATWNVTDANAHPLDVIDLANTLHLPRSEHRAHQQRRRAALAALGGSVLIAAGGGVAFNGLWSSSPALTAAGVGLMAGGATLSIGAPIRWSTRKYQYQHFYARDEINEAVEAHNAKWGHLPQPRR